MQRPRKNGIKVLLISVQNNGLAWLHNTNNRSSLNKDGMKMLVFKLDGCGFAGWSYTGYSGFFP